MRSIRNSLPTEKEHRAHQMSVILKSTKSTNQSSTIDSFATWDVGENLSLRQSQPVKTRDSIAPHRNLESINLFSCCPLPPNRKLPKFTFLWDRKCSSALSACDEQLYTLRKGVQHLQCFHPSCEFSMAPATKHQHFPPDDHRQSLP